MSGARDKDNGVKHSQEGHSFCKGPEVRKLVKQRKQLKPEQREVGRANKNQIMMKVGFILIAEEPLEGSKESVLTSNSNRIQDILTALASSTGKILCEIRILAFSA